MISLSLLKIPVSNLNASVAFYEQALSLKAQFVVEEYGWAQLDGTDIAIALYVPGKGGGDRTIGGSVDFHLASRDLDALKDALPSNASDVGLHENADGSRSLEFRDPDGNLMKIMEQA